MKSNQSASQSFRLSNDTIKCYAILRILYNSCIFADSVRCFTLNTNFSGQEISSIHNAYTVAYDFNIFHDLFSLYRNFSRDIPDYFYILLCPFTKMHSFSFIFKRQKKEILYKKRKFLGKMRSRADFQLILFNFKVRRWYARLGTKWIENIC